MYSLHKFSFSDHAMYPGVPADLEEEEEEEFDWEVEQTLHKEAAEGPLSLQCYYGFGNLRSGVFQRLQVDACLFFLSEKFQVPSSLGGLPGSFCSQEEIVR